MNEEKIRLTKPQIALMRSFREEQAIGHNLEVLRHEFRTASSLERRGFIRFYRGYFGEMALTEKGKEYLEELK